MIVTMTDAPLARTAAYHILNTGYTSSTGPGVAATVSYVTDGEFHIIVDPGMVASQSNILEPLAALGLSAGDITDVILTHHHPDNIVNAGLFGNARMHDHHAIYHGHHWTDRPAEGYEFTASLRLISTPGHSREDITLLAGTSEGIVAFAGDVWWRPDGPADDPITPDREQLALSRKRILAVADVIVPGHGGPFRPTTTTPV